MHKLILAPCLIVLCVGACSANAQSCCNRPAPGSLNYKGTTSRKPAIVLSAPNIEETKIVFDGTISSEKPGDGDKLLVQELKADYSYKLETNGLSKNVRTQLASGKSLSAHVSGTVFTKDGFYWIRAIEITLVQNE